jgi:hypothetical protein
MTDLQDLIDQFRSFRANSRAHATFFLRNGYLHPTAHHIIQARLAQWVRRLEAAGPVVREELLAELEGVAG